MKFEDMINTIQLGNCYELIKDIPDKSIDLVYIDIPYLYNSGGCGNSELSKRTTKKRITLMGANDKYVESVLNNNSAKEALRIAKNKAKNDKDIVDIQSGIDYSILDELNRVMKRIYIYIWCSKNQILDLMNYYVKDKNCIFEIFTWHKTNPTPTHNNCYPPNVGDKKLYNHPTIKPLEVVKNHIINSSKKNDIVLDCFCGSGTTCVACKETGRRYIGMEIDKEYWKIANNRINGIEASGQMTIMFDDKGNVMLGDNK